MTFPSGSNPDLSLSKEQAESIVNRHIEGELSLWGVKEIESNGYSRTSVARTYIVDLSIRNENSPSSSCFVVIQKEEATTGDSYRANTLSAIKQLLSHIHTHTAIPIADPVLDTTHTLVPFDILVCPPSPITSSSILSLSAARASGVLSAQDAAYVDLQIGQFLGQLHTKVQNDWFGQPLAGVPSDPCYSWQEGFTLLLETLLGEHEAEGVPLPYEDIRRHLSRAIGFFLFDDVEVPSLVWLTGSEDDIYVSTKTRGIAAIIPNAAHALWGDPLLENFFMPPAPSDAVLEGYIGSGGGSLIIFPRHKTKRIWYSLFLGLVVLKERRRRSDGDSQWALDLIQRSAGSLADAPCY